MFGTLHRIRVLSRAGLIDVRRPRSVVLAARATRSFGPVAGAVVIGAHHSPNRAAIIDERGSLTYAELDDRAARLASAWRDLGLSEESTVGVLCRDHRGAVVAMVAAGRLGARLVLLNTSFAGPQLATVAAREGVEMLVFDQEFTELLADVDPTITRCLAWVDEPLTAPALTIDDLLVGASSEPPARPRHQGGLVLLTGGTTGTPKGAPRQVRSPLAAAQFLERIPQGKGEVVCIAAPTFHGTGLSQLIMAMALGSTVVIHRRFDAEATIRALHEHQAHTLVAVPTMLQRILSLPAEFLDAHRPRRLRIIVSAGAPLTPDLGNRLVERFGPVVHNFYGCTEVALATVATPDDWIAAPGTVGRPPRGVTVRLLDKDLRTIHRPEISGSIFVRNQLAFGGYSGGGSKPVVDGLMGTGDTGHWDAAGRLFVDGRDDDMIVSGGENVFPAEIEALVASMPGVEDVAAIPVDDEEFGTRLRMFVVAEPHGPDEAAVKACVRANLARFKVPRDVVFIDTIPHTPTGKVTRQELSKRTHRSHTRSTTP